EAIVVRHGQGDQGSDVVRLAKKFRSTVVCIHEAAQWFTRQGVENCMGMNKGGTAQLAGLRVTMTNAVHSSSFEGAVYGGDPAGFVVTFENGATIYFAGDTGPTMDMQIVGDLYQPDVSGLPIGDDYTMGPREAAYAL